LGSLLQMKKTPAKLLELAPAVPAEEVAYWRVSTGRDQSPDMQIAAFKRRGIPDDNIFGDVASGRKAKRPGLQNALRLMAGRPGWTLVIWKLDRLGRDAKELLRLMEEFEEEDWKLVSLTETLDTRTAMGKAFIGMLAVFAEFESNTTKERTAAGMANAKLRGSQVGRNSKLTPEQWSEVEKLLLSPRNKPLSIGRIAHRFRISASAVNLYFLGWRTKTPAQRRAFRREHPLPKQK
jgi:DNA invertase Pin-like site-specific DNA recombinase